MRDTAKMSRRDFMKYTGAVAAGLFAGAGCAVTNPEAKQSYLKDEFLDYPDEIGKLCDKYWEEGKPVEWTLTLLNQTFAVANDIVELPVVGAAEAAGYILGGEKGKEDFRKLGKYIFGNIPGGRDNDEMIKALLTAGLDETLKYAHDAEDTELGALVKTCLVGSSNYFMIDKFINCLFGGGDGKGGAVAPAETPGPTPGDPF